MGECIFSPGFFPAPYLTLMGCVMCMVLCSMKLLCYELPVAVTSISVTALPETANLIYTFRARYNKYKLHHQEKGMML